MISCCVLFTFGFVLHIISSSKVHMCVIGELV